MFCILALFFYILILNIKLMPKITYKNNQGISKTIEVDKGLSVMEGAIQNDVPGIDADCGGSMACATCHVYVEEKWLIKIPDAEEAEVDMIDMAFEPKKNSRLSCQLIVTDELDGLIVTTPEKQS
jgi:2Fe-2S ferredoxin